jgi:hypothetical protein
MGEVSPINEEDDNQAVEGWCHCPYQYPLPCLSVQSSVPDPWHLETDSDPGSLNPYTEYGSGSGSCSFSSMAYKMPTKKIDQSFYC